MNVVAIIPARGGSKGIPRKNLIQFCGYPLISWSIAAARRCPRIDTVYVSTDCREIAAVSVEFGANIIERPAELATDQASSESALIHAANRLEETSGKPDVIAMLQATSPLRETAELDHALQQFESDQCDSMFSAALAEDFLLWKGQPGRLASLNYDWKSRKRRQDADVGESVWVETGSFYLTRTDLLQATGNRLGGRIGVFEVPIWKGFEIDSLEGHELCQMLMKHHKLDQPAPDEFVGRKQ